LNGGLSFRAAVRDDHAFAGGQPVGLDGDRIIELPQRFHRRVRGLGADEAGRRNTGALHEFLGVDFAAFELRILLRGTDDRESVRAKLIDDACDQWDFGPDDSEVGPQRFRKRQIFCGCADSPDLGDARIAGRAENLMAFEGKTPGDGVLAAAAADHENLHDEQSV
jgi:hypothetical protein